MNQKSDLERYVTYGIGGTPQIKENEKKYWLGEFRERVVFALTYEQINHKEAVKMVEEKCKDKRVEKIIVENGVMDNLVDQYMDLAKKYSIDYKMIGIQSDHKEIALVLASNEAVNEEEVLISKIL